MNKLTLRMMEMAVALMLTNGGKVHGFGFGKNGHRRPL